MIMKDRIAKILDDVPQTIPELAEAMAISQPRGDDLAVRHAALR